MKKKTFKRFACILLCLAMLFSTFGFQLTASAKTLSELEAEANAIKKEIANLKKQSSDQNAIKTAIEKQIRNTQSQIDACNAKINSYNSQIAANQAKIDAKNKEIEQDKLTYKKRIRAIYMSNTNSSVQILLGAEDFSSYLELAQMTKSISAHDKALVDRIVAAIKEIEKEIDENKKLAEEQKSLKSTLAAKKAELDAQVSEVNGVIKKISASTSSAESEQARINKEIAQKKAEQQKATDTSKSPTIVYGGDGFLWPVKGFYYISAGYKSNDSVHNGNHDGIDIAGGGIAGAPVRAIADGYVVASFGSCTHNYGKNRSCGCGGGYGNYVSINHGSGYVAWYAHMKSITVSAGSSVKKGQVIGYVGTTGWSTGNHLHFGLKVNGSWVNPMKYSYQS